MTVLLGACALDSASDSQDDGDEFATTEQANVVGTCTAVRMTAPVNGFQVGAGVPTPLSAVATCSGGVTAEYQYWAKPAGAANWSILGSFVPGSSSWTIPVPGSWAISVVARAVGTTGYQARSTAVSGTSIHVNRNPDANLDTITTTENVPGAVDILANDDDPDGDSITITGHTNPSNGSVGFVGSTATYTPNTGYVGADSFTYSLSDGIGGSATGTVSITVADQAPVAVDDVLVSAANSHGTVNVLANDSDPDSDALTVTSFTQGAHGSVAISGGVATYTPAGGYSGADSFSYTVDDGHTMTATANVAVTVTNPSPGCTISVSGPATGVYAQNIHLTSSAICNTGPAQVQWYHKINSAFVMVQAFSATTTLDYAADAVGPGLFYALVRTQGTTPSQGTSNTASVSVADNTPQCSSVRMVAPTNGQTIRVNMAQTLTASATCAGGTPEFQFWVKLASSSTWTTLPGFTTGSSSWTPGSTGSWNVKVVTRTVGSHVSYQVGSSAIAVTVAP